MQEEHELLPSADEQMKVLKKDSKISKEQPKDSQGISKGNDPTQEIKPKALAGNDDNGNNPDPTLIKNPVNTSSKSEVDPAKEALNEATEDSSEMENNLAEESEDDSISERHNIPMGDYAGMSLEDLVKELSRLLRNEKVQVLKDHAEAIKTAFLSGYQDLIDEKKEEFISNGGNEIDFDFTFPIRSQFYEIYNQYKKNRDDYYQILQNNLKQNLKRRNELIDKLKSLISAEEDITTTYSNFKKIQEQWRQVGPIPRQHYNDVWRTYQHHVERFYDFLHLNRDLRDLDFKRNLEDKEKLIKQAEALIKESDVAIAFRELQKLHKFWKEETGPVAPELRDEIWNRFSEATKRVHALRQEYLNKQEAIYAASLKEKQEIVDKIHLLKNKDPKTHKQWQQCIKELELLRNRFFEAGRVPNRQGDHIWKVFKEAVRDFNRRKNIFYKEMKREQHENLLKKTELVKLAQSLMDSEDWDTTTEAMKRMQEEWKNIGHVPHKFSDKIWEQFKGACNHYFDRLRQRKKLDYKSENEIFEQKKMLLEELKELSKGPHPKISIETVKSKIASWSELGSVPQNKRFLEGKFYNLIDNIFEALAITKAEGEMIKYSVRLAAIQGDPKAINREIIFLQRKIEEENQEINQLENNLQFFSEGSEKNPLVKEVFQRLELHRASLAAWRSKLDKVRSLN